MRLFTSENLCSIITFNLAGYRILVGIYFPPNLKINPSFFPLTSSVATEKLITVLFWFSFDIFFYPTLEGFKIFLFSVF